MYMYALDVLDICWCLIYLIFVIYVTSLDVYVCPVRIGECTGGWTVEAAKHVSQLPVCTRL